MASPLSNELCRPGSGVGCTACCGSYLDEMRGRAEFWRVLDSRREDFDAAWERSGVDGLDEFVERRTSIEGIDSETDPHILRRCVFVGSTELEPRTAGCLIHPLRTGGVDLRDHGAYDCETCRRYSCRAQATIEAHVMTALSVACAGDSHLYGLAVVNLRWVTLLERILLVRGTGLAGVKRLFDSHRSEYLRQWLELLVDWPWLDAELPMPGDYIPGAVDELAPIRRTPRIEELADDPLVAEACEILGSSFDTDADGREAMSLIEETLGVVIVGVTERAD